MKTVPLLIFAALAVAVVPASAADAARRSGLVILDESAVKNLGITTETVAPADFEETVFALGQIEVLPGRRAVVSSRIAGRAIEVRAKHDHEIDKGEVAVVVESRQFGEPPPRLDLAAPIDGIVSATHVVPGQPVEPTDVLVEILDLTAVYAIARVPDHLAGGLQRGQRARLKATAVPGITFEAVLEHIGVVADAAAGTIEAAFRVENPELRLRPGMRVEFAIVISRQSGIASVPRAAVQGDATNRFVYVRDFELPHAFIRTPVITGRTNDRRIEILGGLFPADEVVTHGAYSLAFAGTGTISLKEALDAAHGHEHNPDGSEITAAQRRAQAEANTTSQAASAAPTGERIWMFVSAVLFVALVLVGAKLGRSRKN